MSTVKTVKPLSGLLAWYRRNRRDLPWRKDRHPYHVWVAEIMLQQTTTKAVTPYYERFILRFPTVEALSKTREDDVVAAWSGLGYYHRARNLWRGARHVVERHAGQFPAHLESAMAIPGIGLYSASAVLSISFDQPLPVVDGNVRRVLARIHALQGIEAGKDSVYHRLAMELLDRRHPGDWNQALMELGATICVPRRPACAACPVSASCEARRQGLILAIPAAKARRAPQDTHVSAAVIERDGRLLLIRGGPGPLEKLWEVPRTSLDSSSPPELATEMRALHGLEIEAGPLLVRLRHAVTFRRIHLEAYAARLIREPRRDSGDFVWATAEDIERLPVSSLTRKIVRAWKERQLALDF